MARQRTAPPPEPSLIPPKGMIASAVNLPIASPKLAGRNESWHEEAWKLWGQVGEFRLVASWTGNILSQARLVAAKRQGRHLVPITKSGPETEPLEALYGGPQGQSEGLRQYGIHSTVTGEEYIVYLASRKEWHTIASTKVKMLPGGIVEVDIGIENKIRLVPGQDICIRVWTPDPLEPTRSDSPAKAQFATLRQILAYDQHIWAQVISRLAGNGLLLLPNDIEFPLPEGADPNQSSAYAFMKVLAEGMVTPINNPESPSALVPLVAMLPVEALGKIEHLKFWSELDDKVIQLRDAAIKRFATGMDAPPEVLLGLEDSNHWNAWLSEESAVKAFLQPKLGTYAYALTEQYYRKALKGIVDNPEDYFILADTASIRLRPNRASEAIQLYELGTLSPVALRRETGFQEEDAPSKQELKTFLLTRISTGAVSPEQTAAALKELGVDLGLTMEQGTPPPNHTRMDVAPDLFQPGPPAIEQSRQEAVDRGLAAACDVLVFRALERAGNKLKNLHPRSDCTSTPASQLYRSLAGDPDALIAGAWDAAPEALHAYTDIPADVISTLDFYVRGLLETKRPHNRSIMVKLLEKMPSPMPIGGMV